MPKYSAKNVSRMRIPPTPINMGICAALRERSPRNWDEALAARIVGADELRADAAGFDDNKGEADEARRGPAAALGSEPPIGMPMATGMSAPGGAWTIWAMGTCAGRDGGGAAEGAAG